MEFKFDHDVFEAWDVAFDTHQSKQYVWGLPGKSIGVNQYQIEAPEAGKVYIRVLDDAGTSTSVTTAVNLGANLDPKVRVRCQYIEGELTIINPSPKDAIKSYGRNASQTAVPPHSGAIGAGIEDYVETQRLLAGLVHASPEGGWYVRIEGFRFKNQHEPTTDYLIDSGNVPATVGETRLVGIAWDYVTSSFVQIPGTASTKPVNAYDDSDIDALAFGPSEVPLGAVTLYESQTSINDGIARILDARYFFDIAGDVALDANELAYTPTTSGDWPVVPDEVGEALDTLAESVAAVTGRVTKRIVVPASQMTLDPITGPTPGLRQYGSSDIYLPVLSFDHATQNDVYFAVHMPLDMALTDYALAFKLHWMAGADWTTGAYMWQLETQPITFTTDIGSGGAGSGTGPETPSNVSTMIVSSKGTNSGGFIDADTIILCHLYRDTGSGSDTADGHGDVIAVIIEYESDRNGVPV